MNVYQDTLPRSRMEDECVKTDDVYQTLHQPPSVKNPNPTHEPVRSFRIKTVLMVFNTLLLIVILILIGISTAKNQQSADLNKPQASVLGEDSETEELWRLHHSVFYLFWEAEGNCTEALKFCEDRNSRMGTVTHENKDWILSQADGRKLWVKVDGATTGPLNKTLRQCPLDGGNSANSEDVQGWVCESGQQKHLQIPKFPIQTDPLFNFYDSISFEDYGEEAYPTFDYPTFDYEMFISKADLSEDPTAGPERDSPASSAASLLSVTSLVCIITVSALASLRPLHL
ncbi:hypothetical protein MHYP_G00284550 [Metynnis hypsauchen]